jgi:hypothetical protein
MAAVNINNYFQNIFGIADAAFRNALTTQGLTAADSFIGLKDDDIKQICSNIHKPGGQIASPNAAIPGQQALINNPGITVGHIIEKWLTMLAYFENHLQRIQRRFTEVVVTVVRLTAVYLLKEQDDNDDNVGLPSKLTNVANVRECLEDIDDYLRCKRGESGCPLAYVVQLVVALPAAVNDPGFSLHSYDAEMIQRAPHTGLTYQVDNHAVWDIIHHVTHGGPSWDWVSAFARENDGRGAHRSLSTHYLGVSFQAMICAQADKKLESAFYDGRSRSSTFESYCSLLQHLFTDLEQAGDPLSELRKIRFFLKGIWDPRLQSCKDIIVGTPALWVTFDSAVTYAKRIVSELNSLLDTVP